MDIQPIITYTILTKSGYPSLCLKLIGNEWEKVSVAEYRKEIRFLNYVNRHEPVWSNMETGNKMFEIYAGNQVGQPPTAENSLAIYHAFKQATDWGDDSSLQELAFTYTYVSDDHK